MSNKELCDLQNEESAKLIYELQHGVRKLQQHKPYDLGNGPNPDYHDNGIDSLKKKKE